MDPQHPVAIPNDAAADGLRRIGMIEFTSSRIALLRNIFSAFAFIAFLIARPLRSSTPPVHLYFVLIGVIVVGMLAYYLLPKRLIPNNRYRITVHLDSGGRIRLRYDGHEAKAVAAQRKAKAVGEFRPRAVEGGKTQLELRRNWKGRDEWLVFVPDDLSDDELEAHVSNFLPLLSDTIEQQAS